MNYRKHREIGHEIRDISNRIRPSSRSKIYLPFPFIRKRLQTLGDQEQNQNLVSKSKSVDQEVVQIACSILISQGWIPRRNVVDCNLIWAYNLSKIPYAAQPHQRYNHFRDAWILTTKEGLKNTLTKNSSSQMKASSFFPRTYNLESEFLEFEHDYLFTAILITLKKLTTYLTTNFKMTNKDLNIEIDFKKYVSGESDSKFEQITNQVAVVPKHLILYEILLLQKFKRLRQGTMEEKQLSLFDVSKQLIDQLINFSKQNPPYKNSYCYQMLATPSKTTITLVIQYHQYYSKISPSYFSDGLENIWIMKPSDGSRGRYIQLIRNPSQVRGGNCSTRVVQKYIQNLWICTQQQLDYESVPRQLYRLVNKKKDIRIWVFVTKTEPLVAYMFEQGMVRISSQDHDLEELKNKYSHLTNYSINKNHYSDNEQSYVLLSVLLTHLKYKYNHITLLSQIQEIVHKTLQCCDFDQNDRKSKSFQLFGFDFLLDHNLNPWLLQVNMTPACKVRLSQNKQLEKVKQDMIRGMFQILGIIKSKKSRENGEININKWIKISQEQEEQQPLCLDKLQVFGQKIDKNKLNTIDKNIFREESAIKIQKFIRDKISKIVQINNAQVSKQARLISRIKPFISIINKIIINRKQTIFFNISSLKLINTLQPKYKSRVKLASFSNYRKRITSKSFKKPL